MKFKPFSIVIWLLIILWIYVYSDYSNFENKIIVDKERKITIKSWDTLNLLRKKLWLNSITDKYIYKFYIKFNTPENFELQAWEYVLRTDSNIKTIFEALQKPITNDQKITILEWWNIYDIDNYLYSSKELIKKWEFIKKVEKFDKKLVDKYIFLKKTKTLEWFLYPDSYDINPNNFSIDILIDKMLSNFDKKVYKKYLKNYSAKEIMDIINLASIVEKEANSRDNPKEIAIIAWILKQRIVDKWPIWADATACYPYKITHKECTPTFIWKNINADNNYNLRKNLWLPPTPIWNPSEKTIKATIFSTKTPHRFYLHDNDWKIHYAITNREHEVNKSKYIR